MRQRFPSRVRLLITATLSLVLIVGTGLAFTNVSASAFPAVSAGIGSAIAAWWSPPPAAGPSVTTDKADYAPGETVYISGSGFGANDAVTLQVTDIGSIFASLTSTTYATWTVSADGGGAFSATWVVPQEASNRRLRLTATGDPSGLTASVEFTDASIGLYNQCSNDDGDGYPGPPPGNADPGCRWTNGNLQRNNSTYFEGDATVQRLWLTAFTPGAVDQTVTFQYGTTKGGKHAYDFLTDWDHSENWILESDLCQDITGCVGTAETRVDIPDDPLVPNTIEDAINRMAIRGGTITNISAPVMVSGSYAADSETQITVTFSVANSGNMCSASGCDVAFFFGAHIAETDAWFPFNGTTGATSIPGSPYHVALAEFNGASIGQRDNQMQAGAIRVPLGTIIIVKDAVPDDAQDFNFTSPTLTPTSFILDDDADGTRSNTQTFTGVEPGQYTIGETLPVAGWSLTNITCVDPNGGTVPNLGAGNVLVDMVDGETITCTFTNTLNAASITIIKDAIPDNAQNFGFTTTGTGPAGFTGGFTLDDDALAGGDAACSGGNCLKQQTFNFTGASATGSKTITEGAVSGWTLTGLTCSKGSTSTVTRTATISLVPGDNVTCTYENTNQNLLTGRIIVVKQTIPDDATEFTFTTGNYTSVEEGNPFTLSDGQSNDSCGVGNDNCLEPGTYSVAETPNAAYDTSASCSDSSPVNAISLQAGETVTCTFTNRKPDLSIRVDASDVNEVGDDHEFTITVTQVPNGVTPAATANITPSVNPTPDSQSTTCGAAVAFVGNVATCTFTINDFQAGTFDVDASVTATIGSVVLTRDTAGTSGPGGNSGATKRFVDAQIDVTPLTATNEVGDPHQITVTVQQNDGMHPGGDGVDGFGPAPNGTLVEFSFITNEAGATFVGDDDDCTTTAGSCSVSINAPNAGLVVVQATTTFSVGGVSLVRTTGSGGLNSANAQKVYVDAQIDITPLEDTNPINEAHTFTATVQQDDGVHPGGDGVDGFGPAPNGTVVTFAFEQNDIGAVFVGDVNTCTITNGLGTCTVQINSAAPGVLIVSASTTFTVGGVSLTRETGTGGLNGANAQKTYVSGVIITDKVTNPAGDAQLFDFAASWDAGANPDFQLADATAPNNSGPLAPGTYSVTETVPAGWDLESVVCTSSLGGTEDNTAIDLTAGETVTCVFTNEKDANIITDKVTNPAGDAQLFDFAASWDAGANPDFQLADATAPNDSGDLDPGTYSVTETVPAGWDLESVVCTSSLGGTEDNTAIALTAGETVTCVFTNEKDAIIIVDKVTNPNPDASNTAFDFTTTYGSPFTLTNSDTPNNSGDLDPGTYDVVEGDEPGWDLTSISCVSSTGDSTDTDGEDLDLDAGETITCTFTNTQRGTVIFQKTEAGGVTTREFTFEIRKDASEDGLGVVLANATVPIGSDASNDINFVCDGDLLNDDDCENVGTPSVAHFPPGTYQFCETNLLPGWSHTLEMIDGMDDGDVFTPDFNSGGADNSTQCVDIVITAGDELDLGTIDNIPPPGGDAHTIGFWKNWTSCDGRGNQDPVTDWVLWSYGKPAFTPFDTANVTDTAPSTVGDAIAPVVDRPTAYDPGIWLGDTLNIGTCADAIKVLGKQTLTTKLRGKDRAEKVPFLNLTSQLLAAKLNVQAGAETNLGAAPCINEVIARADDYLAFYNWNGLTSSIDLTNEHKTRMNQLAGYLDAYNNNELICPVNLPPAP